MNLRTLQQNDASTNQSLNESNDNLETTQKSAEERIAQVTAEENAKVEEAKNEQIQATGNYTTARRAFAHAIANIGGVVYDAANSMLYHSTNDGTDYVTEKVPQVDMEEEVEEPATSSSSSSSFSS